MFVANIGIVSVQHAAAIGLRSLAVLGSDHGRASMGEFRPLLPLLNAAVPAAMHISQLQ